MPPEHFDEIWAVDKRDGFIFYKFAGVGFGLTPASDRLVVKLMILRDIYKPPQNSKKDYSLRAAKD
jgi:hypothetical protein